MGDQRAGGIAWTDETWNPVRGCSRVSPGCERCYAETMAARFCGSGQAYEGLVKLNGGPGAGKRARWTGVVRTVPEHLADPLKWKRPRRIFVNSMSDLFHEKLSNEDIAAVFGVMAAAPRHTFQILTKRAERWGAWFRWAAENDHVGDGVNACVTTMFGVPALNEFLTRGDDARDERGNDGRFDHLIDDPPEWPLRNVWLGVSVEDQRRADERIPLLLGTPAAVRFVSAEPLLAPVDISRFVWPVHWRWDARHETPEQALAAGAFAEQHRQSLVSAPARFLDWVIVGAESGPGARPMAIEWARALRDQCAPAGVSFFLKQFADERGRKISTPELDGRKWVQFPEARP